MAAPAVWFAGGVALGLMRRPSLRVGCPADLQLVLGALMMVLAAVANSPTAVGAVHCCALPSCRVCVLCSCSQLLPNHLPDRWTGLCVMITCLYHVLSYSGRGTVLQR